MKVMVRGVNSEVPPGHLLHRDAAPNGTADLNGHFAADGVADKPDARLLTGNIKQSGQSLVAARCLNQEAWTSRGARMPSDFSGEVLGI